MSSPPRRTALREAGGRIDVPAAFAAWLCGWLCFNVAGLVVLGAAGYEQADEAAIWVLFVGTAIGWAALLAAMVGASRFAGSGDFGADYSVRATGRDLLGLPLGVLTQLVVIPLAYWPLEQLWPDTFSSDKLSENANDLVDRATGGSMVLLVLMVCLGAPLVEELVYRGMIQGSLANRFHPVPALLVASAFFALIHFRPVEYPGLFLAGLVFGSCLLVTGRLGPAVAAHIGFNVTGLVLALN